jgi:hypothetical protein
VLLSVWRSQNQLPLRDTDVQTQWIKHDSVDQNRQNAQKETIPHLC